MGMPRIRLPAFNEDCVRVCVIVPVRNEVAHIETTLACLLGQTFPHERMEIIVADGMSDDGTRDVVRALIAAHPHVRLVDNERKTIPVGLNRGIAASSAEIVIRVDGRCRIADDYVATCVRLLARSGAANVGGPVRSEGHGTIGEAAALAMRSRFGIGNSRYHYLEREEFVDTVYLGAFRREALEAVGGYDEELIRNQDDELNYRLRAAGYGVFLSPSIRSSYSPPGSLHRVWRSQFYSYGYWKVRVFQKHPGAVLPRQLVPPLLVLTLACSMCAALISRRRGYLLPVAGYAAAVLGAAGITARRRPGLMLPVAAVFACMHLGYGTGFVHGLLRLAMSALRARAPRRKQ